MSLLDHLKAINPSVEKFYSQNVLDSNGTKVGTKYICATSDGSIISGGTSPSDELAKRIAVAEAFERSYLDLIKKDQGFRNKFLWGKFPSSSGFAAGFDWQSTRYRAICEGLERWAWSQWIDKKSFLPSLDPKNLKLTPLAQEFLRPFNETFWFKKNFQISISKEENLNLSFVVFLGCFTDGIYAGSRVSTESEDLFSHPIIEGNRNFHNFQIYKKEPFELKDIIEKRAYFFAENKKSAFDQIKLATNENWAIPQILLLEEFATGNPQVFLFRCLLEDFIGWHLGPVERFVY